MQNPTFDQMRAYLHDQGFALRGSISYLRSAIASPGEKVHLPQLCRQLARLQRMEKHLKKRNLIKLVLYFADERDTWVRDVREGYTPGTPFDFFSHLEWQLEMLANVESFVIFLRQHLRAPHG